MDEKLILTNDEFIEKLRELKGSAKVYEDLNKARFEIHDGVSRYYSPCVFAVSSPETREYIGKVREIVRSY